jgi:molecular chaperone GrpE
MDDPKDINNEQLNKLEELEKQCAEYLDGWKRAKADLINYQKDEQKRFQEFAKYALENVVRDLIAVLDSFNLAIASMESSGKEMDKGVYMIKAQLEDALKKYGLEKIKVSPGDEFNPSLHESLGEMDPPTGGEHPSGAVLVEVEAGYTLNGKVVRPARVKLAK